MTDIVIVAAARTAVGKFGGTLAKTPAPELGAAVVVDLLRRAKLAGDQINEVILGQVLTAGSGQNPARQTVVKSGLPQGVPALTINAVCGSGLKAVMLAAQAIRDGDSEIIIAGGQESMSLAPHVLPNKGDPVVFAADEFINRKSTAEALAGLRPAFDKAGGVTAGNASGLNDGAAGVVVMTAKKADQLGLTPLARIRSYATVALDPSIMGMGPVPASQKALQRAGWKASDLDLLEINEAFAAQACAVNNEMGWDTSKVNVNGGAIAIGHPIGASGCRILVTLLHEMQRRDAKKGIASLCIGGGMGVALTVER